MYKKIKKIEKQIAKINRELEKLKTKPEWPQFGDKYFYCKFLGEVYETTWNDREFDQKSFELGNFYRTREEAENKVRATRLEATIARRRKELNGDWVSDWGDTQNKYHIIYMGCWEPESEALRVGYTGNYLFTAAFGFYKSRDDVRTIIEEFEEELLWYFAEYIPSIN